jgi:Ser/Thr protein kinase RdoA (MazF antagonist)
MQAIFEQYNWDVLNYEVLQQGLINKTYVVETQTGDYILQTINHQVFQNPKLIDFNINLIGNYLKKHDPTYLFTHLVTNIIGETITYLNGFYYRAFVKIKGHALTILENPSQAKQAAAEFAKFTNELIDFNCQQLQITIPDFHNLSLRFAQFSNSMLTGDATRIEAAKESISYLQGQKKLVPIYENFIAHKDVKQRVTHHDTKISNVLFNAAGKAICVIDLDTVMPGYFISDVGDMCRTYLCMVSEEEKQLDLVTIEANRWDALKAGYLSNMKSNLSNFELDHFSYSGQFMIYMQALRFLTDHLNRDVYYGAKYEGQNLVRALNQIELLKRFNEMI